MRVPSEEMLVQGTKVQYFVVCPRKLWLHAKHITMEHTSDIVLEGKVLHEQSFARKKKEIDIDQLIKIDLIDDDYVGEVKSSSRMEKADRLQLLYYLYYLKRLGIHRVGKIHYVKEKKVEEIQLTAEAEQEVEACLSGIQEVLSMDFAPKKKRLPYCTKCAYYPFCFVEEVEE